MSALRTSFSLSSAFCLALSSAAWSAEPKSLNAGGSHAGPAVPTAATRKPYDLIFTPIVPCRAFYSPSAVAANSTANYQITGTGSFVPQGGPAGGCGVPVSAKAVAINLSAVSASSAGYFRANATGAATPPTTVLTYRAAVNETGAATVALGTAGGLSVYSAGKTRIVGDVTGYYAPQIHAVLAPTGGIYDGSERVLSSTRLSQGSYRVQIDRDPAGCTPIPTVNGSAYFASAYVSGGYIYANTYTPGGAAADVYWALAVFC
ncbi:hypothetical protein [Methylopila sp. M107]|uniref:hypothetical protein n=1 Tax=Methylopila sp. M107 TaxID=1101190 RepID=UPI00036F81F1|nr:hypothetical protein [Methylopila sp. M107]